MSSLVVAAMMLAGLLSVPAGPTMAESVVLPSMLAQSTESGGKAPAGQTQQPTSTGNEPKEPAADDKVFRSPDGNPLPEPEEVLKRKPETKTQGYVGPSYGETLLKLGTDEQFIETERALIRAQIKSFIPPLLQSAVAGDAYVLPPNTFRVSVNYSFTNIRGKDDIFGASGFDNFDGIRREWVTASIMYGFDLGHKFLHSFTAILNVPYSNSSVRGSVEPIGPAGPIVNSDGTARGIGPVSLMLKKKIIDQANFPVGIAVISGVYFPTGSNQEKFGSNGVVSCSNTCPGGGSTFVFPRFSPDGRMPTILQPGWGGSWAFMGGAFMTRQLLPGDIPFLAGTPFDRGAIHAGGTYRFNAQSNGFYPGNAATTFISLVEPIYKDYLSLELTNKWIWQQADSYDFPGLLADGRTRGPYVNGLTGMLGPSLIFSPDALIRFHVTSLFRVKDPALGPAPPYLINLGIDVTF